MIPVKLFVQEDAEFRAFVKDLIRGAVNSILSSDLNDLIVDAISNRLPKLIDNGLNDRVKKEIDMFFSGWGMTRDQKIKSVIREMLTEIVTSVVTPESVEAIIRDQVDKSITRLMRTKNEN